MPAEVEYGGKTYPVESVGAYAFANCQEELDSIILSEGITELSGNAFYNCGVRYLNIPSSVYLMRRNPFVRCPRLEEVVIEDSYFPLPLPENLSGSEEMMEGLFHSCPALKRVYIGRTLDYDASEQYGPFHGLTNLEEVTIGEEVEELDEKLFAGCTGLKTVYYNAYSAGFTPSYRYRSPFGEGSAVEQVIVGESVRYIPRGYGPPPRFPQFEAIRHGSLQRVHAARGGAHRRSGRVVLRNVCLRKRQPLVSRRRPLRK